MKKKLLLALTCVVWTASDKAVTVDEIIEDANTISFSYTPPNIFEASEFMSTLNNFCNKTNKWVEASLEKNKSDTLKKIYAQIKEQTREIVNRLKEFNSNLNLIKTNNQMLEKYKKIARSFSAARDTLKTALNQAKTFYTQNEQTKSRSQEIKDAKAEIANILGTYADLFMSIAQKAINDFARIDASLFDEEAVRQKMKKQKPKWVRGELPTEPIPVEETKKGDSSDWSDWDSSNE